MDELKKKLQERKAVVGILGMGYVGLPLALEFAKKGFSVVGFDVDAGKIRSLSRGNSYIPDASSEELQDVVRAGRFTATDEFGRLGRCDAAIVCVPTPLRKTKEPDVTYIQRACERIAATLRRGQLVVLESTTYPGTTREMVLPMFEARGLEVGRDFHLAFSPERVDPGNTKHGIHNTPKVVGGITPGCTELASILYGHVVERVVPVSSTDSAEMVKLLENTFRAVNIALVNEMALMCERLGLDVWETIHAAASKPFGFMPFYPGPGLGGHCIPVDPTYLAWKMKALNFEPRFIELASTINSGMPRYAATRIAGMLNNVKKSVRGSRILVLGIAYKPGVSDTRESPSLDVIKLLMDMGAEVSYHDPFVPAMEFFGRKFRSAALTKSALRRVDLCAILTAHRCVDYTLVLSAAPLVFDARDATAGVARPNLQRL